MVVKWSVLSGIAVMGFALTVAHPLLAVEQQLDGVVLYDFYGLKDAKDLMKSSDMPHLVGADFGVWRAPEPKRIQWIECWIQNIKLPKDQRESFLMVYYSIPGKDSANGMYFKLHSMDYSSFAKGDLIVRMCQARDLTEQRGGKLPTDIVTVELKVLDENSNLQVAQLEKTFSIEQKQQQTKYGSFDLRIPLVDFGDEDGNVNLTRTNEFVLTFNNRSIPPVMHRGVLGIQSILLVKKPITQGSPQERLKKQREQVDVVLKAHRLKKEKK